MDEGQATLETLATVSGYTERAVRDALTALREQGTCVRTKSKVALGFHAPLYSLSPAGIELALATATEFPT